MKMTKIKKEHHLLEEEPELECKMNKKALEVKNVCCKSINTEDKSHFNRIHKKEKSHIGPVEWTSF